MSKTAPDNRHDEAEKWYKEVEANRARLVAEAIQAGTIRPCSRWSEPDRYKVSIATKLTNEPDELSAMATLDGVLQRQIGKYIFFANGSVGQNTTDTQTLKDLISIEVVGLLSDTAHKQRVEYYLNRWREQQPTPVDNLLSSLKLDTPRARTAIERAITQGLIESAPEGLKWRGIGTRGTKAQLGYFCKCAWLPENKERLPEQAIDTLFGVSRIGSTISELMATKTPQKWRADIDSLFTP